MHDVAPYLVLAVLATSTLSGVFGMGGGMILMGIYAWMLPVREAMVLHAVTQIASNGARCLLLRRHLYRPALGWYVLGAAAGIAVFSLWRVVPDRRTVFLVLGGLPLGAALLPARFGFSIEDPRMATACGAIVTSAHLTAGVSGPLLDVFFVRGSLDRHQVIGTKAVTQTLGHLLKLGYFGVLVDAGGTSLPWWSYPVVVVCAIAGTRIGRALLERLDDRRFRVASRGIILAIAVVYLARGAL